MEELRTATLIDILNRSIRLYGKRDLFASEDKDGSAGLMRYEVFGALVKKLRGGLAFLGVDRGDTVAITAGNSPEWAMLAYAAYGLGATFVPMYPTQTPEEWAYIVRDSGAKVVFVQDEASSTRLHSALGFTMKRPRIIPIRNEDGRTWHRYFGDLMSFKPRQAEQVLPDDLAAIIYTSGTTGKPKGVELTHKNIVSNVESARSVLHVGPEDMTCSFLPWAHAFGHTGDLHLMLAAGATIYVCPDPTKIATHLPLARPTVLLSVPKIFAKTKNGVEKQIAEKPWIIREIYRAAMNGNWACWQIANQLIFKKVRTKFGGRLRFAVSGGAALPKDVAHFMETIGITVYEGYGLSETTPVVSLNGTDACRAGTVGKPIPGVCVDIVDDEIVVHGPNVMKGYHNLPEETAEVLTSDGGFRTGDMGRIDKDGFLTITGRIKEQYKLENGKYVVPTPLEDDLRASPLIANVFIYGDNKPYNVALVVPTNDEDEEALRAEIDRLSAKWTPYERIRKIALVSEDFTIENGLLTPKLSIKRPKVLERYKTQIEALYL